MDIRRIDGLWCDDITFCPERCGWMSCPRNKENIRDKTIPHSFSVEIPGDCPKKLNMQDPELKAKWGMDYDHTVDKCYDRPMCPECDAPVVKHKSGEYRCVSCHRFVKIEDPEMLKWLTDREGEKVEMHDCFSPYCDGKKCLETHLVRNNVTLEWQTAWGECKKCGMRFIV